MNSEAQNLIRQLRIVYQEILLGYSYDSSHDLYFKHFNESDLAEIDFELDVYRKTITERGIPTEEEKVTDLIDQKQWPLEKEAAFSSLQTQIKDARNLIQATKDSNVVKSQESLIEDRTKELEEIIKERSELIGKTADHYIAKKQSDLTIFYTFFQDKEFKNKEFDEEEFEYLTQQELNEYVTLYNSMSDKFSVDNIRRIAALPFFLNKFFLSDNNPMTFYGKAVVEMTAFQVDLYAQGKMYKNILENTKEGETPPDEWYADPDRLVEWYFYRSKGGHGAASVKSESSKFSQNDDSFVGGKSIIGADKKDLASATGERGAGVMDLNKELTKISEDKDGEWTMWDLLRLHGESVDQVEKEMQDYHKKQAGEEKKKGK